MINIVIIGIDNSGKTTLGNSLTEFLNRKNTCKYIHSLGNVPLEDQLNFLNHELLEDINYDYKIFDRFPIIEEKIYGNILRNNNRYENLGVEDYWLSKIDIFILCNPGFETISNWGEREQMEGVIDNSKKIYKAYINLYNELKNKGYNIKIYNFKKDDYHNLI